MIFTIFQPVKSVNCFDVFQKLFLQFLIGNMDFCDTADKCPNPRDQFTGIIYIRRKPAGIFLQMYHSSTAFFPFQPLRDVLFPGSITNGKFHMFHTVPPSVLCADTPHVFLHFIQLLSHLVKTLTDFSNFYRSDMICPKR